MKKSLNYSIESRKKSMQIPCRKSYSVSGSRSQNRKRGQTLPKLSQKNRPSNTPTLPSDSMSQERSKMITLKYLQLEKYPKKFDTYYEYKNKEGEVVPLLHRDKVTKILVILDKIVQPILNKYNIIYSSLSENHPLSRKPAVTHRIPLKFITPTMFAHMIQIRVRNQQGPNDYRKFYNRATLLAMLFHELAHIRFMNHGKEFMFFLRDIYQYAHFINIIPAEDHQLPSFRKWEKAIFHARGNISNSKLIEIYES